ncbi:unnamed protein product, partial [Chrysoparadoxa australica]
MRHEARAAQMKALLRAYVHEQWAEGEDTDAKLAAAELWVELDKERKDRCKAEAQLAQVMSSGAPKPGPRDSQTHKPAMRVKELHHRSTSSGPTERVTRSQQLRRRVRDVGDAPRVERESPKARVRSREGEVQSSVEPEEVSDSLWRALFVSQRVTQQAKEDAAERASLESQLATAMRQLERLKVLHHADEESLEEKRSLEAEVVALRRDLAQLEKGAADNAEGANLCPMTAREGEAFCRFVEQELQKRRERKRWGGGEQQSSPPAPFAQQQMELLKAKCGEMEQVVQNEAKTAEWLVDELRMTRKDVQKRDEELQGVKHDQEKLAEKLKDSQARHEAQMEVLLKQLECAHGNTSGLTQSQVLEELLSRGISLKALEEQGELRAETSQELAAQLDQVLAQELPHKLDWLSSLRSSDGVAPAASPSAMTRSTEVNSERDGEELGLGLGLDVSRASQAGEVTLALREVQALRSALLGTVAEGEEQRVELEALRAEVRKTAKVVARTAKQEPEPFRADEAEAEEEAEDDEGEQPSEMEGLREDLRGSEQARRDLASEVRELRDRVEEAARLRGPEGITTTTATTAASTGTGSPAVEVARVLFADASAQSGAEGQGAPAPSDDVTSREVDGLRAELQESELARRDVAAEVRELRGRLVSAE